MSDNGSPQITIVVDGIEISAPEGQMLVDSAKHGDIEIPVFCYEPKLGDPVGACRMCLVEIEGMPKLQTACSTPIRDGMVIYTQNERVSEAQNAVVEFLLVNHPLDCPVCDKGGECPLQDIAMGWGPGKSRFTDPKRHFQKPIPLSPLVKIDRERCILCYRCVRFSQEVAEDEQLQLIERGPKTYVGTHDDRPYVAPFHGNIIELCPVGALTSQSYRFRARPWEIEQAGSVCTLCPSQCNVKYSVRDEGVARVLARDNEEVDDGWLCDKGRFGYQMFTSPDRPTGAQLRSGGALEPVRWDEAIERGAEGLGAAKGKVAALVGGGASNEEAYLIQRMVRGPLASTDVSSSRRGALAASTRRALADPKLAVTTRQLDDADAIVVIGADPMHEMPILELRIRKAVRRNATDLVIATERPTSLDGGAAIGTSGPLEAHRYEPGAAAEFLEGLVRSISGDGDDGTGIAEALDGKERVVIVWGERVLEADGERTAAALLELASSLGLAEVAGAGLYEIPIDANGRGVRESGACENAGPGLADLAGGRTSDEIRDALEAGELEALILWDVDPVRDFDDPEAWSRAIGAANFTLSSSMFGNASEQNSDLHFPAETHAEKEGTVTHPDGRLQRVRPSVPRPGNNRPLWQVLTELSAALGDETGAETSGEVFELLASESPLYRGMTHDTIGGFGVRWQDINPSALSTGVGGKGSADPGRPDGVVSGEAHEPPSGRSAEPSPPTYDAPGESSEDTRGARTSDGPSPDPAAADDSGIRLGTYPDLWADYVAERNEALRFLSPSQTVEINVQLAKELGLGNGQTVNVVAPSGKSVRASVAIRERIADGTAFLIEGTAEDGANQLGEARFVRIEAAPDEGGAPAEPVEQLGVSEREPVEW